MSNEQQNIMGYMTNAGYQLMPDWKDFWAQRLEHFTAFYHSPNPKATQEELQLYQGYLWVLGDFITNFIYTGNITTYSDFEARLEQFEATPQGGQGRLLYDHQLDYFEKKESGHNFEKKKKSAKPVQPQQAKKVPQKKEEVEVLRKDDPKIDLAELSTREWNRATYPKFEDLRRPNVNIVFIGHVDAGKSTLSGRIMLNLKIVDETEYKKLEQEAKSLNRQGWELAFITDNIQQEKDKGKTIECSKTVFGLPNRRFTLFDAPGHANYVPNMIMGACQADMALLIISSKDGEFESGFDKEGQTKQHSILARSLGVSVVVCAVTKMGTHKWSKDRYNFIKDSVTPFLLDTIKYEKVIFLPIDSLENKNIDTRNTGDVCDWYEGPSVLELLNDIELRPKHPMGPLRIPIVDKIKDQGQLNIYGKVESGTLLEEQTVTLLPSKQSFIVKEIFDPSDNRIPYAPAGENVKLKVKMIEEEDIQRGNMICNNQNYCQVCHVFSAKLHVLELPETKKLISSGSQAVIHLHSSVEDVEVVEVEAIQHPETKKLAKASFLKSHQTGIVQIKSRNELCLEKFDFMPELARFTLRDQGKTIGYGEIRKFKASQVLTSEQKVQLTKNQVRPSQQAP